MLVHGRNGKLGRGHSCWGSVPLASLGVGTLADSRPQRRAWAWAILQRDGHCGELGSGRSCPRLVRSGEIGRGKHFVIFFSDLIGKIELVVWGFGLSCFCRFQLKHYAYIKSSLIYTEAGSLFASRVNSLSQVCFVQCSFEFPRYIINSNQEGRFQTIREPK